MRKIIFGIIGVLFLLTSLWLGYYFYKKSKQDPIVYETATPFDTTIVKKSVATGSIVPRKEVQIKSPVSGVIQDVYVEAGDIVRKGQLIARVSLVPNLNSINSDQVTINTARNNLETAKINYRNAEIELKRQKKLYDQKVISQQEYISFERDYNLQRESVQAAERNLSLVQQGALQRSGGASNEVYSTVDGVVLDVPLKQGGSVIERSNFNEGTTIASIADMNNLVFEGKIDESEVGKLKEGMDLNLNIGAIEGKVFKAKLEYISPKGIEEEGAIKFEIRAQILLREGDYLRAGYSANADIVLDKKNKTMAIKESMLQFSGDSVFVEVETQKQIFEKRLIKTGISDGINIEVLSGLKKTDKVKIPQAEREKG